MHQLKFSFAVIVAALVAAPAHAEPVAGEQDPNQILQSAVDQIVESDEFTVDFEFTVRVGMPGAEHGRFARYKIAMARPNRLLFLRTKGDMGATMASDGEVLLAYISELDQQTQQPAHKTLDEFSQSRSGMTLIANGMGGFMMALLADDPMARLTEGVTSSEYVGLEEIDGDECHHLRFVREDWDFDVWVTDGEAPTIRRIRPDLTKELGEEERELGFSITLSLEYTTWNFAPEIDEKSFAYSPPATAKLVETFTPRMPAPVTPPVVVAHPLLSEPAPEFSLQPLEGEEKTKLADSLGKQVVVLDFWATWCPPCVAGLPKLSEVAADFKNRNVAFFAVNVQEDAETIREFLENADPKIELPVLLDTDGAVGKQYKVGGIPQTVLIGLDGTVQVIHIGLLADMKAELSRQIEDLLAGKDLAAEETTEPEEATAESQEKTADESTEEEGTAKE